ncbi:MAG: CPBP family intramembrane metalloprotease [Proteobacteria bacterium]|nr:CPBP family intramembrane metalloprotease [Pseudomonadota bacterium]
MSFDTLFILIILLLLAVVFPLLGVRDYRLLLRRTNEGVADARVKFYKGVLVFHWPLTIGLLAWWLLSGNSLESMGLIPVADGWPWAAIGVGVFAILAQVIYLAIVSRNADKLTEVKKQIGDLANLAPQTPREDRLFDMVSITAGVCEEILYRGLLLATLVSLVGTWPAVAITSLIFGLGHAYQGISGIAKTGLVGLVLALLTVSSGSLFIAIVLHAVIDLTSGRIMGRALRNTTLQTA